MENSVLQIGEMSPNQAIELLYKAIDKATQRGVFNLNESGLNRDAIVVIAKLVELTKQVEKINE